MDASIDVVLGMHGDPIDMKLMVVNFSGRVLSCAETVGTHPSMPEDGNKQIQKVIEETIRQAGSTADRVKCLVAGLPGLDFHKDYAWAEKVTAAPGLACLHVHVDRMVTAHTGVFTAKPGIAVLSLASRPPNRWTTTYAVTESGRTMGEMTFGHYTQMSFHYLAYNAITRMICGYVTELDHAFFEEALAFFHISHIRELPDILLNDNRRTPPISMEDSDRIDRFGPSVLEAAKRGTPLAKQVCAEMIGELKLGVQLLASFFEQEHIAVALTPDFLRDPYMLECAEKALHGSREGDVGRQHFHFVEPALSGVAGAALMALDRAGVPINEQVVKTIGEHPMSVLA